MRGEYKHEGHNLQQRKRKKDYGLYFGIQFVFVHCVFFHSFLIHYSKLTRSPVLGSEPIDPGETK